jgi:regulator of sirC expression with transglutaminase-like and TPR domain
MTNEFTRLLERNDYRLEEAALSYARAIAYPNLDFAPTLQALDAHAQAIQSRLNGDETRRQILQRINEHLFEEVGYRGNLSQYYDPDNSYLNQVVERRLGIPITLSLVYIAVAERLKLTVYGVGLPGHFVAGCGLETGQVIYIDSFNSGTFMTEDECRQLSKLYLAPELPFSAHFFLPQSKTDMLRRMLMNLRNIYLGNMPRDLDVACRTLECLYPFMPNDRDINRTLGIFYASRNLPQKAIRYLRHYLGLFPTAEDSQELRDLLNKLLNSVSRMN